MQLRQRGVLKTQEFTRPLEPALERAMALTSGIGSTVSRKIEGMGRTQKRVTGAVLAAVLASGGFFLVVPAILFLPVTLILLGGFFFCSFLALPVLTSFMWVLVCTKPVQSKVIGPLVERLLRYETVKKVLTSE